MKRMHPLKRLNKIIRDTKQIITDIEWWNRNRTDAPPIDCEFERVLLAKALKCRAAWDPDDTREYGRRSMRNISFFLTTPQFVAGTKDVTRRLGWSKLKPGDRLMAVVKSQGLKPGEKIERLGEIEVVSVRRERLNEIDQADVVREGFPTMTPAGFVTMFCIHMGGSEDQLVNRIEFRKVK
jgi:hypothetical protein